jgi:hypothetical protein
LGVSPLQAASDGGVAIPDRDCRPAGERPDSAAAAEDHIVPEAEAECAILADLGRR